MTRRSARLPAFARSAPARLAVALAEAAGRPSADPKVRPYRMMPRFRARPVVAGTAEGLTLVSHEPLSFWGGFDHKTGEIIDRRHPLSGEVATGRILAVPFTRGSSTTTAVLLEAVRSRTAPAAILTPAFDSFLALASIVAEEMYGTSIPILVLEPEDFSQLRTGQLVRIDAGGMVEIG